jgi:hypothetical protein
MPAFPGVRVGLSSFPSLCEPSVDQFPIPYLGECGGRHQHLSLAHAMILGRSNVALEPNLDFRPRTILELSKNRVPRNLNEPYDPRVSHAKRTAPDGRRSGYAVVIGRTVSPPSRGASSR